MPLLPKFVHGVNAIPNKIPAVFAETKNLTFKYLWQCQEMRIAKIVS
jgi:hypothetical protein